MPSAMAVPRPPRHLMEWQDEQELERTVDQELFERAGRQAVPETVPVPVAPSMICADQKTFDLHMQMEAEGVLADPSMAREARCP